MGEIKHRGRWKADASLKRYEKSARILREAERLPASTMKHGKLIDIRLAKVLLGKVKLPKPPGQDSFISASRRRRRDLDGDTFHPEQCCEAETRRRLEEARRQCGAPAGRKLFIKELFAGRGTVSQCLLRAASRPMLALSCEGP